MVHMKTLKSFNNNSHYVVNYLNIILIYMILCLNVVRISLIIHQKRLLNI